MLVPVSLTAMQRTYYKAILNKNHAVLSHPKKKASLINVLMELKKCANHPYLFPGAEKEKFASHVSKKNILKALHMFGNV